MTTKNLSEMAGEELLREFVLRSSYARAYGTEEDIQATREIHAELLRLLNIGRKVKSEKEIAVGFLLNYQSRANSLADSGLYTKGWNDCLQDMVNAAKMLPVSGPAAKEDK